MFDCIVMLLKHLQIYMDSSVDGLCLFKHISIMEYVDVENEFGLIVSVDSTPVLNGEDSYL